MGTYGLLDLIHVCVVGCTESSTEPRVNQANYGRAPMTRSCPHDAHGRAGNMPALAAPNMLPHCAITAEENHVGFRISQSSSILLRSKPQRTIHNFCGKGVAPSVTALGRPAKRKKVQGQSRLLDEDARKVLCAGGRSQDSLRRDRQPNKAHMPGRIASHIPPRRMLPEKSHLRPDDLRR